MLISVLPRHIASNMMADIVGKIKHERFRKMYMTRHENVRYVYSSEFHMIFHDKFWHW